MASYIHFSNKTCYFYNFNPQRLAQHFVKFQSQVIIANTNIDLITLEKEQEFVETRRQGTGWNALPLSHAQSR